MPEHKGRGEGVLEEKVEKEGEEIEKVVKEEEKEARLSSDLAAAIGDFFSLL